MLPNTEPTLGAITDSEGRFTIKGVPVGTHTLRVLKMGFLTIEKPGVVVGESSTATVRFTLKQSVVDEIDEIKVQGERKRIEKDSSTTKQRVSKENLESLPVDTFQEAVGLKAGVVSQGGELHFRGGRSGEVLYMIDGIPVRDPLAGGSVQVATNAVSDSEVLLGGFDAEFGNAQSGIVNISTQEGGSRFAGEVSYSTDDFGAPDKTYDNFDRMNIGFGGPTQVKDLT
jgi:outer membrane cobalamin receptor